MIFYQSKKGRPTRHTLCNVRQVTYINLSRESETLKSKAVLYQSQDVVLKRGPRSLVLAIVLLSRSGRVFRHHRSLFDNNVLRYGSVRRPLTGKWPLKERLIGVSGSETEVSVHDHRLDFQAIILINVKINILCCECISFQNSYN